MISKTIINEIFSTAKIEEIISEFVYLKPYGNNMRGLSPFVKEKTPSFIVSPTKKIWKDFSSGKGGNVIGFLMEHENFTYIEALKYIAQKYNIKIQSNKTINAQKIDSQKIKENIYIIQNIAKTFFQNNIWSSEEGKINGLQYFYSRQFNDKTIHKFQIGYALNLQSSLHNFLLNQKLNKDIIKKSGLCYYNNIEQGIDRFRYRIIFPIFNILGKVIGFGGRTLLKDKYTPKYLNSPETEIYHKGKILYGLYQAKNSIIQYNNCILVEGYTDVIRLYQNGITNVVSPLGTALTEEQIFLIKRFTSNVTIIFDGDTSGIQASYRIINLMLKADMNIKLFLCPNQEDPDTFFKEYQSNEINKIINNNSINFIQFKIQTWLQKKENNIIDKSEIIQDIIYSISLIKNFIKQELYIQESARILKIPENILRKELDVQNNTTINNNDKNNNNINCKNNISNFEITIYQKKTLCDQYLDLEKNIIQTMFKYGGYIIEPTYMNHQSYKITVIEEIINQLKSDNIKFKNNLYQKILQNIEEGLIKGEIRNGTFYTQSEDEIIIKEVINSLLDKYELSKNWKKKGIHIKDKKDNLSNLVKDLILRYKLLIINELINKISSKIQSTAIENNIKRKNFYQQLVKLIKFKNNILKNELNQLT